MPIVLLLVLMLAAPSHAQCCGDCDNDGRVTIADVVRTVNAALSDDCGPVPVTGCPYTFGELTTTQTCRFAGRFNGTCGGRLRALVAGDEDTVIALLTTDPAVGFIGVRTGPTTADLIAWSVDPFDDSEPIGGVMRLLDGGTRLAIAPDDAPFSYGGCDFVTFAGDYER